MEHESPIKVGTVCAIHPIEFNQKSSQREIFRLIDSKYLNATQPKPNWVRETHVRWKICRLRTICYFLSLSQSLARSVCILRWVTRQRNINIIWSKLIQSTSVPARSSLCFAIRINFCNNQQPQNIDYLFNNKKTVLVRFLKFSLSIWEKKCTVWARWTCTSKPVPVLRKRPVSLFDFVSATEFNEIEHNLRKCPADAEV